MVEATGSNVASWPTVDLKQLVKEVEKARESGKYLIVWDRNGAVEMFFKYKGHLCDWAPQQLRLKIQ